MSLPRYPVSEPIDENAFNCFRRSTTRKYMSPQGRILGGRRVGPFFAVYGYALFKPRHGLIYELMICSVTRHRVDRGKRFFRIRKSIIKYYPIVNSLVRRPFTTRVGRAVAVPTTHDRVWPRWYTGGTLIDGREGTTSASPSREIVAILYVPFPRVANIVKFVDYIVVTYDKYLNVYKVRLSAFKLDSSVIPWTVRVKCKLNVLFLLVFCVYKIHLYRRTVHRMMHASHTAAYKQLFCKQYRK